MAKIKLKRGLEENIPQLEVGEPGFTTDSKKLFIGTEDGNKLVGADLLVKISWQDLIDLRDNEELVPGTFYQITDYVAPANSPIEEMKLPIDVIVFAQSSSILSENAQAIYVVEPQEEKVFSFDNEFDDGYDTNTFFDEVVIDGDTYYRWLSSDAEGGVKYLLTLDRNPQEGSVVVGHQYIDSSTEELVEFYSGEKEKIVENVVYGSDVERVESWKLRYCLDNDIERFEWANDAETGVVYWIEKEEPLKEIRFEKHEFVIEEGETSIQTELNFTKEYLSTLSVYIRYVNEEESSLIKVVDNGIALEGFDWADDADNGYFYLYDNNPNYDDIILYAFYRNNEDEEAVKGYLKSWYAPIEIVLEEPIKNTKPYIFYKRHEVFTKEEALKKLQTEKELLQFDNDTLSASLDTVSETLYSLQQNSGNPIILGTTKEPSESGKIGKYSNSYIITPKRVFNGKFVEYHWDISKWPFNEMVEVEEDGNTFIKVPKMFIKLVRDDNDIIKERYISDTQIDGDWLLPQMFYDHADGSELDYALTAKYNTHVYGGVAISQSGKATTTNMTIGDFRAATKSNGPGYHLFDMHTKFVWETLYLIVFGHTRPDEYFPQGGTNPGAQDTGALDGMTHHTGYTTGLPNYLMKFMGVENLFSNVYTWVDGVKTYAGTVYVADYEENYNGDNNLNNYYSIGGIANHGHISALGSSQGLFSIPLETNGDTGKDFYQNYSSPNKGNYYTTLFFGRTWYSFVRDGLFYWLGHYAFSNTYSAVGSRLVKKPLH